MSPADVAEQWRAARPPSATIQFDAASAGRSSLPVLEATAQHAQREATLGAAVAAAKAAPVIERLRSQLADLLGVPADGVAFTESGTSARQTLLHAWPLTPGDSVAVLRSEWGPTLSALETRRLRIVELSSHDDGTVDLDALRRRLADDPPSVVQLTAVASHRPLVQPVADAAAICRDANVPLWVDAAQALGHIDTAYGADAVFATSRKWLAGPRGVGILAVAERWWDRLRVEVSPLERVHAGAGAPPMRLLESTEGHIAGRVGLAVAVQEHLALGPELVRNRLAEVGRMTRDVLDGLASWRVAEGREMPVAITALRPTAGQSVAAVRDQLLADHRIVTTSAHPARAPREMTEPLLRVSPHVDCTVEELELLRAALAAV